MYEKYVKRIIDIVLSLVGLVLLSPLLLIIALLIKLDSKGRCCLNKKGWQKVKHIFLF